MRRFRFSIIAGLLAAVIPAQADISSATLTFSEFANDGVLAEVLDARVTWTVDDVLNTLSIEIFNDTTDPFPFRINELHFDAAPNITDVLLTDTPTNVPTSFVFAQDFGASTAAGFGMYDAFLELTRQNRLIKPGQSKVWGFSIIGTNPSAADFVSEPSVMSPGDLTPPNIESIAAVKFLQGPDGANSYGNVVPEPAALLLFGVGGLAVFGMHRRRG